MTHRRSFLAGAALAFAARPAFAAPLQLRVSTAAAEGDWLTRALLRMKAGLEAALPGQFAVAVHPNSALFRQGTELPALQRGNLEMSTMTTFEVDQQLPELGVLSAGYAIRDTDHLRKIFAGDVGQEYRALVAARMGVEILSVFYLGTRQLNLRTARAVAKPGDLAGVKCRMPPGPGWTALGRGIGVTPTPMPMPEVYLALKSGAVDGQENPLALTRTNNLHEVTGQIVMTSHLVQPVFCAVAKPFFDKLDAGQQAALRREAEAAAAFNNEGRMAEEQELVAFFRKAGLQVATPDLAAFRAAVRRQYAEAGIDTKWMPGLEARVAAVG
jgi:TRAP-type C4-dicarboxylate transport system substrate-binding protein